MKKLFIILCISFTTLYAKVNIIVSIAPQETFVKAIGKDKIDVTVMVKAGDFPHTYEPKPSEMKDITKADIYLSIGMEFENIWLKKFQQINNDMKIFATQKDIHKIAMIKHHHHKLHQHDDDKGISLDPHIWTSPSNVKIIAKNILEALIIIDKKNTKYYQDNYKVFLKKIEKTDIQIKDILKNKKQDRFMVFHPAWGYFAKEYNLKQIPIEVEGKNPKPKDIIKIIKKIKKDKINIIIIAPELSDKMAKQIAKQANIKTAKVGHLDKNWSETLIKLANLI